MEEAIADVNIDKMNEIQIERKRKICKFNRTSIFYLPNAGADEMETNFIQTRFLVLGGFPRLGVSLNVP